MARSVRLGGGSSPANVTRTMGGAESWRGAWETHARTVAAAAVALSGPGGTTALIESIIPDAIVEGTNYFDPLEAFLTPMLRGRSRTERARVAAVLSGHGIAPDRARRLSGASGERRSRHAGRAVASGLHAVEPPTFDRMLTLVNQLPPQEPTTVPRRMGRGSLAAVAIGVVVALSGAGAFAASTSSSAELPLLAVAGELPPRWELATASAREPVEVVSNSPLVQRVRTDNSNGRFELRIGAGNTRFADRHLGALVDSSPEYPDPVERLGHRDVHIIRARPGLTFMGAWVERTPGKDVPVSIELQGFSLRDSRKMIGSLTAKRNLERDGFALPPWWRSELQHPTRSRSSSASTQLSFRSLDYPDLQVQVEVTPQHHPDPGPDNFFFGPATQNGTRVRRRLRANLVVDEVLDPWGATISWRDKGHRVWANVTTFGPGPPSHIAVAGLESIIRALEFTGRRGWERSIAPLRAQMAAEPIVEMVHGPHELAYRFFNHEHDPRTIICARTICAPMESGEDGFYTDLIVDGHWWHVERFFHSPVPPRWRTSPSDKGPVTAELSAADGVLWRLVDFGTKVRVARRNDEPVPFTRPVL